MKRICPHCELKNLTSGGRTDAVKNGHYRRSSDGQRIQKYVCKTCSGNFSAASHSDCKYQKKRQLNYWIRAFNCSGVSQRRLALLLRISRTTVAHKVFFLGVRAERKLKQENERRGKTKVIQIDDLITSEHTKLKPISVIAAVVEDERYIVDLEVASMPSFGKLKHKSIEKYGPREDTRPHARKALLERIEPFVNEDVIIKSDESPHYPKDFKERFPKSTHLTYKGRRGCVVGQGELKATSFDELFSLNHTYAMFRANVNRLFRRTWNTTKKMQRLRAHLFLYAEFHNSFVLAHPTTKRK